MTRLMKTLPLLERHLSRRQVAQLAGVHTETIKRAQRRGDLPAIVLNSRLTRYRERDVIRWLDAKVHDSRSLNFSSPGTSDESSQP